MNIMYFYYILCSTGDYNNSLWKVYANIEKQTNRYLWDSLKTKTFK